MILEPISTKIISVRIVGVSPLIWPELWPKKNRSCLQHWPKFSDCTTEGGGPGIPIAVIKHALVSAADQIHELKKED